MFAVEFWTEFLAAGAVECILNEMDAQSNTEIPDHKERPGPAFVRSMAIEQGFEVLGQLARAFYMTEQPPPANVAHRFTQMKSEAWRIIVQITKYWIEESTVRALLFFLMWCPRGLLVCSM